MKTMASVRFTREGFHRWEGATGIRAYLKDRHRHLFHVEVNLEVFHDDREIEFHDLLEECKLQFPSGEFGTASCEFLAAGLLNHLKQKYPFRDISVSVYEDGEVGAIVQYTKYTRHP